MACEVEQILLFLGCGREFREILGIDDDMAGRASHDSLACALEWFARGPGDVKQPLTGRRFHFLVEGSVLPEKPHQGHASRCSCATAAAAIRLHASTRSCCLV